MLKLNIPILDLKKQYAEIQDAVEAAVLEVLRSGWHVLGPNVSAFETEAAEFLGTKHAIGCANGSDALYLALLSLGVKPGDEVITTPFTYIATAEAIDQIGAKPVFADIDLETYNIDAAEIESKITDRTKAIIVVHLYGQCCDMQSVMEIARKHELKVIEDAAQAFGAAGIGQLGDIATYSFYPTKNLGCAGDGGLLTTNSSELDADLRKRRVHGTYKRYHHDVLGVNSRLDELQAAILRVKLKHIARWNARRAEIAKIYSEAIEEFNASDTNTIKLFGTELKLFEGAKPAGMQLVAPVPSPKATEIGHIFHQYTVRVSFNSQSHCEQSEAISQEFVQKQIEIASALPRNDENSPQIITGSDFSDFQPRDIIRAQLKSQGVSTEIYYPVALHQQPVYQSLGYQAEDLPNALEASESIFCLPIYPELEI